ncbi:MAG TPA: hypothetical protein HA257_06805 [Candidatus Methanoperedenaceae archaeon]|nr:hypothetical protein [Candidatus Methanoperedenaceae archaeon]
MQTVRLVKEMGYERIYCTCGMAVLPRDPSPDLTMKIKKVAREAGAQFLLNDISVHPEFRDMYGIKSLPAVVVGEKAYPPDEELIRKALRDAG